MQLFVSSYRFSCCYTFFIACRVITTLPVVWVNYVCYHKPFHVKQLKRRHQVHLNRLKTYTDSQKAFAANLETVKDIHANTDTLREVETQWKSISENIDLIASQQKIINQLYDTSIAIGETIPGIQAEYNLMVDQMARQDMPSSQVVIAKNQVFIAERILRSISSVLTGTDSSRESADDFSADTETFGAYLAAQLNGSAELGVQRITQEDLRSSLEGIQAEYEDVLKSAAATVLKNSSQIVKVRQASSSIFDSVR